MNDYISVHNLNLHIKKIIENNQSLNNINLVGEISNFTHHSKSGHFYFTLKDEKSSIRAVMFKGHNSSISIKPEDGLKVIVKGDVKVYVPHGIYQFFCRQMIPYGEGDYKIAFERLKQELFELGILQKKLDIKSHIQKLNTIGIITSEDGAALQDILSVIRRRNPLIKVYIYPAIMQGENCAKSVISCFQKANNDDICDIILITRGGGSIEDLWQFNNKDLAYAIYKRKKPVISAIGHEIDFTILDFVADLRAATPSVAAEIISENIFIIDFNDIKQRLTNKLLHKIDYYYDSLQILNERLDMGIFNYIKNKETEFKTLVQIFDKVNLFSILNRGYSIIEKNNKVIKDIKDIKVKDNINIRLKDGIVNAQVKSIEK